MDSQPSKKLVVKVSTVRSTKRLGLAPTDFKTLKERCEQIEPKLKTQDFCITYADNTGDVINVSDDEDLHEAYDVAQSELKGQLKLSIQARVGELDLESSQITERRSMRGESQMDTSVFDAPESERSNYIKVDAPVEEAKKPDGQKKGDEEEFQINSSLIRAELDDMMNSSKKDDSENECMSSDSDEEDNKAKRKIHKKKLGNAGNKVMKGKHGMPRKVFKKMIKKELEKQQAEIFQKLYSCEEIGQDQRLADDAQISSASEAGQVKHMHVECDGCGVAPITGPRFKCSVCKNFDYCAACEERREHPHAFLKINNPSQAPTAIFAVIDENQHPGAKTDGDINAGASVFGAHPQPPHGPPHRWGGGHHGGPKQHHGHGGPRHPHWKGGKPGKHCPFMGGKKEHVPFAGQGHRADGVSGSQPQAEQNNSAQNQCGSFDQAAFQRDLQNTMQNLFKNLNVDQQAQNSCRGLEQHMQSLFRNCQGGNPSGQNGQNGHRPWRVNRGQLVSAPTEAIVCQVGKSALARIEMRNNTHWPYKQGCVLRSQFTGLAADSLEEVYVPIDTYVPEMSNFFLNIPLSVNDSAILTYETEHTADFHICGPRGNPFGEKISIKFKIVKQLDQDELYRIAVKIFDQLDSAEDGLFELVVESVKEANNDEKLALEILAKKRYAEEDDLYS